MKLSMSNRDKRILLYAGGILIVLVTYLYGYQKLQTQQETLEAQHTKLQNDDQKLQQLAEDEDTYLADTQTMKSETEAMIQSFPPMVLEEDSTLYADQMEEHKDVVVNAIAFTPGNLLGSMGDGSETADILDEGSASIGTIDESQVKLPTYSLYNTAVTYDFTSGYQSFKEIYQEILDHTDKRNVDSFSLSYDTESGKLIGNMTVNLYYLTGTDRTYNEPFTGNISHGKRNLFGTLEHNNTDDEEDVTP